MAAPHTARGAQSEDELRLMEAVLNQRARFSLAGRVVDQDAKPLTGVRLTVEVHQFDADSLETTRVSRHQVLADGRFEIEQSDATAVVLLARWLPRG